MANKTLAYMGIGILILILLGSIFITFNAGSENQPTGQVTYKSNTPQECKPPAGQDIASWKEHLGHHAETKYCLEYYD